VRTKLRVAAYAICVREDHVLLARLRARDGAPEWTLPGGGMEHGEDPYDAVIREVEEETGYRIEVTGLLGVDSIRHSVRHRFGRTVDHHGVRLVYEGRVVGGALLPQALDFARAGGTPIEVGGSTDLAAWQDLTALPGLRRVGLIDTGLALWRQRPAAGRTVLPEG
jgi:8-oxo-dGTP diphosphatase